MGRDALFESLPANGLLIRRRKRRVSTPFSSHRFRKYPNLIQELVVDRLNQLWPGRRCGYEVAESLHAVHSKAALQMALDRINPQIGKTLIHHSGGLQYCCADYVSLVDSFAIQISMTESGDPLENRTGGPAITERVNGHRGAGSLRTSI